MAGSSPLEHTICFQFGDTMDQVVTGSNIFWIMPRMMMSINVSASQEFTFELCKEIFLYPQLDFNVWQSVTWHS
jgi:hypothetical protein